MEKSQIRKIQRNAIIATTIAAGLTYFAILRRMNTMESEIRNLTIAVQEEIDIANMLLEYGTVSDSQE